MNSCRTRTNGRVNITGPNISNLFSLYDKNKIHNPVTFRDAFIPNIEADDLTQTFFSQQNIDNLQTQIISGVLHVSNGQYKIAKQSQDNLVIIMRDVFEQGAQNSLNQNLSLTEKKNALNRIVLNYCIPRIFNSVKSYYLYVRDSSTMPNPLPHPISLDYNNKQLEMKAPWISK